MFPGSRTERPAIREARESTEALEKRFTANLTLGQREMIAVRLRDLASEIIAAGEPDALVDRYRAMEAKLKAIDDEQFGELRQRLQSGAITPDDYRNMLGQIPQYDWDAWTRRLFDLHIIPPTTVALTADMVGYVTTHVIQIFEMVSELTPSDVLYDLGSGLGVVPILASWLSGCKSVGIEIEPVFVERARQQAKAVGLADKVTFVEKDLREQDYPDATAIFMFYPVRDKLLEQVIARIEPVARKRAIKLYSLGLSGPALIAKPWIKVRGQSPSGLLALESVPG